MTTNLTTSYTPSTSRPTTVTHAEPSAVPAHADAHTDAGGLTLPSGAATHNSVAISPSAVERLKIVAAEQGVELVGVRVGVTGGGCSGLSYVLDFEKAPRLGDQVFGESPKIFVDRKSFVFLRGTTLDFEGGLNGKGFVFSNPNAKSSCGCGSSFSA